MTWGIRGPGSRIQRIHLDIEFDTIRGRHRYRLGVQVSVHIVGLTAEGPSQHHPLDSQA